MSDKASESSNLEKRIEQQNKRDEQQLYQGERQREEQIEKQKSQKGEGTSQEQQQQQEIVQNKQREVQLQEQKQQQKKENACSSNRDIRYELMNRSDSSNAYSSDMSAASRSNNNSNNKNSNNEYSPDDKEDIAERTRRLDAVEKNVPRNWEGLRQFKGEEGQYHSVRTDGPGGDTEINYDKVGVTDKKITYPDEVIKISRPPGSADSPSTEKQMGKKEIEAKEIEKTIQDQRDDISKKGDHLTRNADSTLATHTQENRERRESAISHGDEFRFGDHIGGRLADVIDKNIDQIEQSLIGEPRDSAVWKATSTLVETVGTLLKGVSDVLRMGKGLDDARAALNDEKKDMIEKASGVLKGVTEDLIRASSLLAPIAGTLEKAAVGQAEKAAVGQAEKAAVGQAEKAATAQRQVEILEEFEEAGKWDSRPNRSMESEVDKVSDRPNPRTSTLETAADHAKALRESFKEAQIKIPEGYEPHHIVPSTDPRAIEARQILRDADIDINSVENGVILPKGPEVPNPNGSLRHEFTFPEDYITKITDRLKVAKTQGNVRDRLLEIGRELYEGIGKFANKSK